MPLTSLDLSGCNQLTNNSLLPLRRLPLKHLSLENCTRIGVEDMLEMVMEIAELSSLDLGGQLGPRLTRWDLLRLPVLSNLTRLSLPNVGQRMSIDWYRGFLLQWPALRPLDCLVVGGKRVVFEVERMRLQSH